MSINPKKIIAVDVGTTSVKVAQLKKVGAGFELVKVGWADVLFEHGDTTFISLTQARSEALRSAMKHAGVSLSSVVTSISGDNAVVRFIQLPDMPQDELKSALHWEAQEILPFPIEDVILDFKTMAYPKPADNNSSKLDVLVVAAEKKIIADHESLLQSAQVKTLAVNVDSFAMLRMYDYYVQGTVAENQTVALLNFGASQTNLVITGKGGARFVRDIPISGNTITEIIAQRLNCSFMRAEQLKVEHGSPRKQGQLQSGEESLGSDRSTLLSSSLHEVVDKRLEGDSALSQNGPDMVVDAVVRQILGNLQKEIAKTITFFLNMSAETEAVSKIVLTGGSALTSKLADYWASETSYKVEVLNPFEKIAVSVGDSEKEQAVKNQGAAFSIVLGLAVQIFDNPDIVKNLNVVSVTSKNAISSKKAIDFSGIAGAGHKFVMILAGLLLFLVVALAWGYLSYTALDDALATQKQEQERLEKNKTLLKKSEEEMARVAALDQTVEDKFAIIAALAPQDRIYWSEKLNMLAKARAGRQVYLERIKLVETILSEETEESKQRRADWQDKKEKFERDNKDSKKKFLDPEPKKAEYPIIQYTLNLYGIASGTDSSVRLAEIYRYADTLTALRWVRASGEEVGFMDGFSPEYRILEQEVKEVGGVDCMAFGLAFDSKLHKAPVVPWMNLDDLLSSATLGHDTASTASENGGKN